jgi:PAS domain S-box-containing protein
MWNLEGAITAANEAFLHMVQYAREDIASGRVRWTDLTPVEWRGRDERAIADLKTSGIFRPFEKEYFRKDGSRVPVLLGGAFFEDSGNEGVAFVLDLTEQKRAQEALARSERQFRALFEEAAVGIALVDSHGRPFASNRKLQQMLGYDADELHRMPFTQFTHPDDVDADWTLFSDVMNHRRDQYHIEKRYVRKDGGLVWGHLTVYVVRDERGEPMFTIGMVEDITERKRAEESLRQAQAELSHVTRVATLGELAASIAHEVNQPLAAIVADATASLNWLAGAHPDLERVREAVEAIVTDGNRAADVIQRIRQLATKSPPEKARLDINGVIRDAVPLVRAELLRHQVALQLDLGPELPPVAGDRVQLQQVVINLVINAVEAMASLTDRPRQVVIRSAPHQPGYVTVSVQDTGIGIDPTTLDALFGAFFTTKPGGMGMGLSISRSIIEAHSGRLSATSNSDHGATFHFVLPAMR